MSYSKDVIFQILTPKAIRKGCLHACNTDLKTFKLATIVFVVDHTKKNRCGIIKEERKATDHIYIIHN